VHPVQDRNVEQGFLGTCFCHLTKPRIQQMKSGFIRKSVANSSALLCFPGVDFLNQAIERTNAQHDY
jgi:hypothetical protein